MKKLIAIILSVFLCISLTVSVFALDILEEAVKKFQELYPDIPYEEIVDVISGNEGLDTAKIKEALDSLVSKYTTATTESTTKKATESTTKKKSESTGTTSTQKATTTQSTTSFTYPTRSNSTATEGTTSSGSINIVLPNQTVTEQQSNQAVSVYQVQPNTTYPNINNNTTQTQSTTDTSKGLSSKTIMAIVIIAVGGLLLLVCIIVLATSSTSSNLPSSGRRRRRRRHSKGKGKDDALRGYVPFAQAVMPEVKINTAADMASKKKGINPDEKTDSTAVSDGRYNLSAFDIPIDTYSPDGTVDASTAEAIDAAIAYAAAKAAEYNSEYKNSITSAPEINKKGTAAAAAILNESVKQDRICPDCGKYVDEDLMFCPECGAFMGIANDMLIAEEEEQQQEAEASTEPSVISEEQPESEENEQDIMKEFDFASFDEQNEFLSVENKEFEQNTETINEDSFLNDEPAIIEGRICPECKAVVEDGLMFCPECGFFMDEDNSEKDTITDANEAFSN